MPRELVARVDPREYGWKAHYLGLLSELGYRTPHAVAFGTREHAGPKDLTSLFAMSFAVRSSAVCEDTFERSNAGSFLTCLEVDQAAVPCAIERVRMSGHGEPMGVVVQDFVQPTVSGVAFSIEPTTYSYDTWAVSWVTGTGDGLVAGRRRANDVLFDATTGEVRTGDWLGDSRLASELHSTLSRLSEALGGPVDIEWCLDAAGQLAVLQVRPVVLPSAGVVDLGTDQAFQQLPAVVSGHPKIALRRRAAELGITMTPSRVTVATSRERPGQPLPTRSPTIAGSSVVLLHPFTVAHRVVRQFAKVDRSDVEFFTAECRRYSIRTYPAFESIADTERHIASIGLQSAAVAVALEQEIWDAEITGIIRRIDDGYLVEVGLGHFVPKGYVETSSYVTYRDGTIRSRKEVAQSAAYHFVNGHVVREEAPDDVPWLSDKQLAWIIDSLDPLLEMEPDLALEFGVTKRADGGRVYLIDAAESDDPGTTFEADALVGGVLSRGRAVGPVVDLRRTGRSEDLDAHLYQRVVGEAPDGPTIFIAERASVDLLPLLYACPPGCGFLFEEASLLAHFAVVLRERGVPAAILAPAELDRLHNTVVLDTARTPPVTIQPGRD